MCAAEGLSDLCSREVNTWSAGAVSPGSQFSIFHFCSFKSLHFFICIICMNAMHCVKNVERHITVCWSKA